MSDRTAQKNVALPDDFGARLAELREQRHLSKSELAEKAGVTYRTVQNLEQQRRSRAQQRTLLAVAEALGVEYAELVGSAGAADRASAARPRSPLLIALAVVVAVAAAFGGLRLYGAAHPVWRVSEDRHMIAARDGVFRWPLWEYVTVETITQIEPAPWDDRVLLFGQGGHRSDGGGLFAVDLGSGEQLWRARPDSAALAAYFEPELLSAGHMGCGRFAFLDADGDGRQEIAARFVHSYYNPTAVCRIGQDGRLLSQYAHRGHLVEMLVMDLDRDGREELVLAGVNNAPSYGGGAVVLLDGDHWRGAAADSACSPWTAQPDSARARLVMRRLPDPYQALVADERLQARDLTLYSAGGTDHRLGVRLRGHLDYDLFNVFMDENLNITGSSITDWFAQKIRAELPDSLWAGTGPTDDVWRAEWLAGSAHFTAGHWPPAETRTAAADAGRKVPPAIR
jgi:transcriptional regulator with XRE-family HTH domain